MCDAYVINSVKERMISRRNFFKGTAAATAGAALASMVSPSAALADGHSQVIDLTHTLTPDFPTYFGTPQFATESVFNFGDNGFNLLNLTINEHTGTHIDAPLHFSEDGQSVDELAISSLVAPLCVIDIAARAAEDPDTRVTPEDVQAWIDANGEIPDGACVAMNSGWDAKVTTDAFRGFDGEVLHFPGFHAEAAEMLLETGAGSIGVDTLSLDYGLSGDFITHYTWLPAGRIGIENIKNLSEVPAAGATIIIGAPKLAGGTGGPSRIFALV
ncbi:MAG: cyclase family protein [Pseudomonadota bacterium]